MAAGQTVEGKLDLFVAIDRAAKVAVAQPGEMADRRTAWAFLWRLLEAGSSHVRSALAGNGTRSPK
jgi:hypothetical protein